ncbi:MAG: TPM domain-containing protein [Candidatus Aenigmarchaeota archaeon]|nr:TPM domain-containing protein [Candidatus Aenigmarchaeota archaeon]
MPIAKAQDTFPSPVGFVNDFANILTDTTSLEYELSEYEKNTTIEIALVTLQELPEDQTLFTYGVELFQYWQIGKKGEDNGILILIVPNGTIGKRLRIELGYGIQGYITGAEAGRILDQALPYYEQGDYQSAAEATIAGLKEQLVNYQPGQAIRQSQANIETTFTATFMLFFALMILIPIAYSIFGNKCPNCGARGQLKCEYDGSAYYKCTCKKCGHSFRKKRSNFMFVPIAGGFSGGGGGFGGFGGGGSGGGGAGR